MFDSLYVNCPNCGNELEFQSKSGVCFLYSYKKNNLPTEVAMGMDGNIVKCDFCNTNFKLECKIPEVVKIKLIKTNKKEDYRGNYNPDSLKNKKENKRLRKMFGLK